LGLSLKIARADDHIYLLQGAPLLYVFRHQPADPNSVLDFEGEAYMHGIMYREAIDTDSLVFRKMTIHQNSLTPRIQLVVGMFRIKNVREKIW
jgi:hypothetical protein